MTKILQSNEQGICDAYGKIRWSGEGTFSYGENLRGQQEKSLPCQWVEMHTFREIS